MSLIQFVFPRIVFIKHIIIKLVWYYLSFLWFPYYTKRDIGAMFKLVGIIYYWATKYNIVTRLLSWRWRRFSCPKQISRKNMVIPGKGNLRQGFHAKIKRWLGLLSLPEHFGVAGNSHFVSRLFHLERGIELLTFVFRVCQMQCLLDFRICHYVPIGKIPE